MSDELPFSEDDPDEPARGRALWGFAALAGVAVIVVVLMVFLLGDPGGNGSDHHNNQLGLPGPTGVQSTSPSATRTTPAPSATPTKHSSTPSTRTSSTAPRTSCPSTSPCVSGGDPGAVIAAVNSYRTHHGQPAARGTVSPAAQQCAVHEGDQSACPSSYSWEPAESANGAQVIDKIIARGGGTSWLLDPKAKSFAVGWAYVPGAHGQGGHYSCAIVMPG